jgi:hypothetical protein
MFTAADEPKSYDFYEHLNDEDYRGADINPGKDLGFQVVRVFVGVIEAEGDGRDDDGHDDHVLEVVVLSEVVDFYSEWMLRTKAKQ